ncbi:MAG: hypothetical protein SFY32_16790 [Bacteroidota bacterium]|nr:hypothetical protein [Bacteroidota bacterium]
MVFDSTTIQNLINYFMERDFLDYLSIFLESIIVIIAVALGNYFSNRSYNRQENEKLERLFKYFQSYVIYQKERIQSQIDSIVSFKESCEKSKDFKHITIHKVVQPYFILDSINKQDLFESFRIQKSDRDLIKYLTDLEIIKITFENFLFENDSYVESINFLNDEWNKEFSDFKVNAEDYISGLIIINGYEIKIKETFQKFQNKYEIPSLVETMTDLITPLSDLDNEIMNNRQIIFKNPGDYFHVHDNLNELNLIYKKWEATKNEYSIQLGKTIENLNIKKMEI